MYPDARGVSLAARGPRAFTFAHSSRARGCAACWSWPPSARRSPRPARRTASGSSSPACRTACCRTSSSASRPTATGLQQITKGHRTRRSRRSRRRERRSCSRVSAAGIFVMNLDGSGAAPARRAARTTCSRSGRRTASDRFRAAVQGRVAPLPDERDRRGVRRLKQAPPSGRPSWTGEQQVASSFPRGALEKLDAATGKLTRALPVPRRRAVRRRPLAESKKVAFYGPRPSLPGCGEVSCVVFALYLARRARQR